MELADFDTCQDFNEAATDPRVMKLLKAANDNNGQNLAVLVIDVQREYCDPDHPELRGTPETVKISERISMTIPKFRTEGVPVYAIYFDDTLQKNPNTVDWFKFKPQSSDICIAKNKDSAFEGSAINNILNKNGHKTLLVCGFNRSACVSATIIDAREAGFDVFLLYDLTCNDRSMRKIPTAEDYARFKESNIELIESDIVLQNLPTKLSQTPRMSA